MPDGSAHDPGGRRLLRLPPDVVAGARFSDCERYRYALSRTWGSKAGSVLFVMMNPSTAGYTYDDPTVAKCRRYARRWGFEHLWVGNVFAYRCTDQDRLLEVADPIGPENDRWLTWLALGPALIVVAYGTPRHKGLRGRGPAVARMLRQHGHTLHVLRLSADGVPAHPLYLPETLEPQPWLP